MKHSIDRARAMGLTLGIVGAVAGTAAAQVMPWHSAVGRALALLAAIAVGIVPLTVNNAGPQQIRDWIRLRSVAEQLKSQVYLYLVGAAPYRGSDTSELLVDHADRVIADAGDLARHTSGLTAHVRPLPPVTDIASYLDERVRGQADNYYRPRAAEMNRRQRRIHRLELALTAVAVVLGAVSTAFQAGWAAAWVATVTTMTAAVSAHIAATRYAYQELEFSRTAAELENLAARYDLGQATEGDDIVVERCERAIATQNDAWMTKWLAE
ncbi:DUF4231 domain-containing protein [Nocardia zapadnayensis]|nr:DUF4231 domain-containing protein [Nocardia zapadnayensis]